MLQSFLLVLFMVLIGALIGGMTNYLAIKMLFRPHQPIYIGKYKMPFTPGLIPKRRVELANQLGKTVANHLLTAEGLENKLSEPAFKDKMIKWFQKEVEQLLTSDQSLAQLLEKHTGCTHSQEQFETKINHLLIYLLDDKLEEIKNGKLSDVLPGTLLRNIDDQIPHIAGNISEKISAYVAGHEGRERLYSVIQQFSVRRGMWGHVLQKMVESERFVDFVHREVIKILNDPVTHESVEQFLRTEWEEILHKTVGEIIENFGNVKIMDDLQQHLVDQISLQYWFQTPLVKLTQPHSQLILQHWVPRIINLVGRMLLAKLEPILNQAEIENIVKEQVEQFPLTRIEEIVLSIARKELKMITFIGAFIGGLIGLVQGIFAGFLM